MSNEAEKNLNIEEKEKSASEVPVQAAGGQSPSGEGGLSPEHIAQLLKVLSDDIILDMLESAGLEDEATDDAPADGPDKAESAEDSGGADGREEIPDSAESSDVQKPVKRKRPRRKITAKRRFLFVILFVLIILTVYAINRIYMSVSINSDDPIQYSTQTDEISADNGTLRVNNVSVTVPSDGTEKYSISYSWSEEDDKYPSVPHAITAIYPDTESAAGEADADTQSEEEAMLYSISLYRNETISKKDVKKSGKKADAWFDDWTAVSEGDVLQTPLKSGDINGFYIFPKEADEPDEASEYNDYSYYFAVDDSDGISIYVIEGVCINEEHSAEFRTIMDNCIHSISVK